MGCVLGKRATQHNQPKGPKPISCCGKNDEESSVTHNVEQVVRKGGDAPVGLRPEFSLKSNNGWPEWLRDVAGDAIKDWTPRRANTFEKIDKVS